MGARWPQEEWKPNTVELEVSIVFHEQMLNSKSNFFAGYGFSMRCYLLDVNYIGYEFRKFPKHGQVFSKII